MSTPSAMASSKAASMSASSHNPNQQALYTANRAPNAPPLAVPGAMPSMLVCGVTEPATVEAVCVPWPSASRADRKKGLPTDSRGSSASKPLE